MAVGVRYAFMRRKLINILTCLADLDFQLAAWVEAEHELHEPTPYTNLAMTANMLLDGFIWDANERLIGALFRDEVELAACLTVVQRITQFLQLKPTDLADDVYTTDPDWLPIVAAARQAIRVLHKGER